MTKNQLSQLLDEDKRLLTSDLEDGKTNVTCLNLMQCKQICRQFGGDIHVESQLGIGSSFTFQMQVFKIEN